MAYNPCPLSRHWYYKVFMEGFHLSFGQPHSDTCGKCNALKVKIDDAEDESILELETSSAC